MTPELRKRLKHEVSEIQKRRYGHVMKLEQAARSARTRKLNRAIAEVMR